MVLHADSLRELLDKKLEEPHIEYKSWMDLTNPEVRAKLAKHICGLSNYGGGFLVFGIADDGKPAEHHPTDLSGYRQDVVNDIVAKYLIPAIHCNVHMVAATNGEEFPIVVVPPHGHSPICAKSNGPMIKGKTVGVREGVHYTRIAGPKTVAVNNPELWRQILRRCVLAEKEQLLSAISGLISTPVLGVSDFKIEPLIDELLARWIRNLPKQLWNVDLRSNRAIYAFQLLNSERQPVAAIELKALREGARQAAFEADQFRPSDMPMFQNIGHGDATSVSLFQGVDCFEMQYVHKDGNYLLCPTLGLLTVSGGGGEVRAFWEDTSWCKNAVEERSSREWPLGKKLTPAYQSHRVIHLLAFIKRLSREYKDAKFAAVALDYAGLDGRSLGDPSPGVYFSVDYKASTAHRRWETTAELDSLTTQQMANVTASLLGPIFRLFDAWPLTAESVLKYMKR